MKIHNLRAAARAANRLFDPTVAGEPFVVRKGARCQSDVEPWNPYIDSEQALELAADLRVSTLFCGRDSEPAVAAIGRGDMAKCFSWQPYDPSKAGDGLRAMREAIVECASRIAKERGL